MIETSNVVYAPKVNPLTLWQMSDENFNAWRREHDYPRIIAFLKLKLPEFENWMTDQCISDELLIKYSPSTFVKEKTCYLYTVLNNNSDEKEILSSIKYSINEIFHQNLVKKRKKFIPYPIWYQAKTKARATPLHVNQISGRCHLMLSRLELLDLGNCTISNLLLGNRKLDFVNISDLQITNCYSTSFLELSFSSAYNLTIKGDLPFLDAYETNFSYGHSIRTNNLKLITGSFQRWRLIKCRVDLYADNSVLQLWELTGEDFDATINSTEIRDCTFKSLQIKYPIQIGRARTFHANIKRLYSQIGKRKEASHHYYWEKTFERKSFLSIKANHRESLFGKYKKVDKVLIHTIFFFKFIRSSFLNILWGYGERPARVFLVSIATIFIFAFCYCFMENSSPETFHNFENSLYFSMLTFATGDINQTNDSIRLLCGLEALLGLSFWGIMIAGFTNNAKDY